jgi:hypothetical protein
VRSESTVLQERDQNEPMVCPGTRKGSTCVAGYDNTGMHTRNRNQIQGTPRQVCACRDASNPKENADVRQDDKVMLVRGEHDGFRVKICPIGQKMKACFSCLGLQLLPEVYCR